MKETTHTREKAAAHSADNFLERSAKKHEAMATQEELEKLQYLSLVSRVCVELENHINMSDKVLAEFMIELALKSPTAKAFYQELEANEAGVDESFAESLFKLIMRMKPGGAGAAGSSSSASTSSTSTAGLSA